MTAKRAGMCTCISRSAKNVAGGSRIHLVTGSMSQTCMTHTRFWCSTPCSAKFPMETNFLVQFLRNVTLPFQDTKKPMEDWHSSKPTIRIDSNAREPSTADDWSKTQACARGSRFCHDSNQRQLPRMRSLNPNSRDFCRLLFDTIRSFFLVWELEYESISKHTRQKLMWVHTRRPDRH